MKQMIKETAPEVKRENLGESLITDWAKPNPILEFLLCQSEEDCWEAVHEITDITPYPGTTFTHLSEVARGLRIPDCDLKRLRSKLQSLVANPRYDELFPEQSPGKIHEIAKESGVDFYDATARTGMRYFCIKQDDDTSVRLLPLGIFRQDKAVRNGMYGGRVFRTISGRGILALCTAIHRSSVLHSENAEILNRVVEITMSTEKEVSPMEVESSPMESTPETPAEPAPEPARMDYAETLRKLFDSVLTLVEKQAEERGAEKVIQQLKEAGKL